MKHKIIPLLMLSLFAVTNGFAFSGEKSEDVKRQERQQESIKRLDVPLCEITIPDAHHSTNRWSLVNKYTDKVYDQADVSVSDVVYLLGLDSVEIFDVQANKKTKSASPFDKDDVKKCKEIFARHLNLTKSQMYDFRTLSKWYLGFAQSVTNKDSKYLKSHGGLLSGTSSTVMRDTLFKCLYKNFDDLKCATQTELKDIHLIPKGYEQHVNISINKCIFDTMTYDELYDFYKSCESFASSKEYETIMETRRKATEQASIEAEVDKAIAKREKIDAMQINAFISKVSDKLFNYYGNEGVRDAMTEDMAREYLKTRIMPKSSNDVEQIVIRNTINALNDSCNYKMLTKDIYVGYDDYVAAVDNYSNNGGFTNQKKLEKAKKFCKMWLDATKE